MPPSNRRDDLLRKIKALIAQASDPSVGMEESEAFRTKADELMAKYMVEEFELLKAGNIQTAPESRQVNMGWWVRNILDDQEARNLSYSLFNEVYRHCRCFVSHKINYGEEYTMFCAGYPGDLDYADLLFTSLLLQLAGAVNPQPSPQLDYFHNLERMRAAGLNWNDAARRMLSAEGVDIPRTVLQYRNFEGKRDKMIRDYRAWCKRTGTPQNYAQWQTHRRSFTLGYINQVATRLRERQRQNEDRTSEGGQSYALVLRDVYDSVLNWVYENYPEFKPKPPPPTKDTIKKGRRVAQPKEKAFSAAGYYQGMEAGRNADIQGSPDKRVSGHFSELQKGD